MCKDFIRLFVIVVVFRCSFFFKSWEYTIAEKVLKPTFFELTLLLLSIFTKEYTQGQNWDDFFGSPTIMIYDLRLWPSTNILFFWFDT